MFAYAYLIANQLTDKSALHLQVADSCLLRWEWPSMILQEPLSLPLPKCGPSHYFHEVAIKGPNTDVSSLLLRVLWHGGVEPDQSLVSTVSNLVVGCCTRFSVVGRDPSACISIEVDNEEINVLGTTGVLCVRLHRDDVNVPLRIKR